MLTMFFFNFIRSPLVPNQRIDISDHNPYKAILKRDTPYDRPDGI